MASQESSCAGSRSPFGNRFDCAKTDGREGNRLKLTISALAPLSEIHGFHLYSPLGQLTRSPFDRAQNANMRAATAQVAGQGGFDLAIGGPGSFIEKSFGRHDHAVDTVATLHCLLVDKGLLDLVHLFSCAQPFEGGDGFVLHRTDGSDAGTNRVAVHDHGASAALRQATAELGTVELEIVA